MLLAGVKTLPMEKSETPSPESSLQKYKEFYDLSLQVLQHEDERFRTIDEKATRYFSVLTILVGAAGFFGQWLCEKVVPAKTGLEFTLFVFALFSFCGLVTAWVLLFLVMILRPMQAIPMNEEMIAFWKDNDLLNIYNALAKKNGQAVEMNIRITNRKTGLLRAGYYTVAVSLVFLIIFGFLFVIHAWTTNVR